MAITRHGVDLDAPTLDIYPDMVKDHGDYFYFKQLAETLGKPLRCCDRRPPPKPANAFVVRRGQMRNNVAYERAKAQAARENKVLWVLDDDDEEETA